MKLISLNTWGGRAGKDKLLRFFKSHKDVDIFCLQEIYSTPYEQLEGRTSGKDIEDAKTMVHGGQEIAAQLDTHIAYFRPHHLENYGLMMLVKKGLYVIFEGDVFVYKDKDHIPEGDVGFHSRNVQFVTIETEKGNRSILNFHGLWNGEGKGDSGDRLLQSDRMLKFMETLSNPFVITGDFNLLPDTKSIKKLEDFGLRNLIKEYGITSTRTSYYTKPEKFADYAFSSKGIIVNDFQVLPDEVSDHSALYLDFE